MQISSDSHSAGKPRPSARSFVPLLGARILLVEDSPDQQRLFAALLKYAGATVTLECNGQGAVTTVIRAPEEFDAVVMDFTMPVMDGVEATERLRQHGFARPIIAITANGSTRLEQSWRAAGCNAYLSKPLDVTGLVETVRRLVAPALEPVPETF